jgi:hypothetical protein
MCGFTGFTNHIKNADKTLTEMMNTIIHRGPDSSGKYTDEDIALGFRRLSIIDLEQGDQPVFNEDGSKILLYLHDTGLLYDDVWEYLENNKIKADFVSLDCTFVTLPGSGGHLGLDTCKITADMMREKGIADENTVFCVNHFSHNGGAIYDELVPIAAKDGFLTSYDGMEVEI